MGRLLAAVIKVIFIYLKQRRLHCLLLASLLINHLLLSLLQLLLRGLELGMVRRVLLMVLLVAAR
jgi:hypothetical protein